MDRFTMSLYDDFDAVKQKPEQMPGWSSGIKLLQSQMQLKKATQSQVKRDALRKTNLSASILQNLSPIAQFINNRKEEEPNSSPLNVSMFSTFPNKKPIDDMIKETKINNHASTGEPQDWDVEWNFEDEYSPFWPNDYDKVVRDLRELKEKEREKEEEERRKRREERNKNRERIENDDSRRKIARSDNEDSDIELERPNMRGGVAIAPPPMLQDASTIDITPKPSGGPNHGVSVAAKIMAKYGFKEGQGLGKKEQGISVALQVEKTSKRGGRIIHEKEMMPPPLFDMNFKGNSPSSPHNSNFASKPDPSITEIMKTQSKVVLLRNMVGPGEVDQDLEPEVKDECNTKYGDVIKVLIHELPGEDPEEAVRIFVEFKRIESAVKAVIDLNGRFFGGRQVKAGFYSCDKFASFQLLE